MYNPQSPEDAWEWVELCNATGQAVDLAGWVMDDDNGTAVLAPNIPAGTVPALGCAVLYNGEDLSYTEFAMAWPEVTTLVAVNPWSAGSLNNGGDTIGLWSSFGDYAGDHETHNNVLLGLSYDDSDPWPADDGAASIQLVGGGLDPSDGANWALSALGDAFGSLQSQTYGSNTGQDVGRPGRCATPVFRDGFESGTTDAWSS
jgi:hypothetical protein